jgi:thioredoxin-related protein
MVNADILTDKLWFMRKIIFALFTCWMAEQACASDLAWLDNVPQAIDQAKRENKLIMLDFTGSDWCGWCKKLNAETFSKPEFINYAGKNLVLVEVDFPAHKPLSDTVKAANKALKENYKVKGFPTLVVLKPDGTVLWQKVGYLAGGPEAMIAKLNELSLKTAPLTLAAPAQGPAPAAQKAGDGPRLQAIFYSASHSSIILNSKSCAEGDSVDGMHVLKIARDKVTVEYNGKAMELIMK